MITKLITKLQGHNKPMLTHSSGTLGETGALVQLGAKYYSQTDNILVAYLKSVILISESEPV